MFYECVAPHQGAVLFEVPQQYVADIFSVYIIQAYRMNQFRRVTSRHCGAFAIRLIATEAVEGNPSKCHAMLTIQIKIGEDRAATLCYQTQAKRARSRVAPPLID